MKIMKMKGPWWLFLNINIHIQYFFLRLQVWSLLGLCVPGVTEGPCIPYWPFRTLSEAKMGIGQPNRLFGHYGPDKKDLKPFVQYIKFGDLKTIFHWRSPSIHWTIDTAVISKWGRCLWKSPGYTGSVNEFKLKVFFVVVKEVRIVMIWKMCLYLNIHKNLLCNMPA